MRLKIYTALLSCASLFASGDSDAEDHFESGAKEQEAPLTVSCDLSPPTRSDQTCPCPFPHRIEIGGNYTYAWITPEGNPTTSGNLGGAQFLYEYCPPRSIYAAVAFSWRTGDTESSPTASRSLQDFNIQERIGYTLSFSRYQTRATLFSGIGARYLPETVTVGTASVEFDYAEFYVPVGCLLEKQFNSYFSFGVNFQWMPHIFPTVRIDPLSGTHWDLTYQLNNFFIEVPFKFTNCSNRFYLTLAPFFELWHDGESTAAATNGVGGPVGAVLGLPSNTYLFTGVNVNLGATF